MARNSPNIDYSEDYYRGFAKIYFDGIISKIIEFGNLKNEKGVILDFGCGVGHLKKTLKNPKVVGYDIIPELSDVKDYKKIIPDKIICNAVLEHLHGEEVDNLMKDFIKMNSNADLIVSLPTENIFSKIGMLLTGNLNAHDDHILKYRKANKIIEKYYKIHKRSYYFLRMAQITKYTKK